MFQVKHLATDPRHHAVRARRLTRRMGVVLQSGLSIKQRGARLTEIGRDDILADFGKLTDAVSDGLLEIVCEDGYVLSPDMLQGDDWESVLAEFKKHLGSGDLEKLNEQPSAPMEMVVSEGAPKVTVIEAPLSPVPEVKAAPKAMAEEVTPAPAKKKVEVPGEDSLRSMKRGELERLAKRLELDPDKFSNKEALIKGILKHKE